MSQLVVKHKYINVYKYQANFQYTKSEKLIEKQKTIMKVGFIIIKKACFFCRPHQTKNHSSSIRPFITA
jgi:hypothetical protein